MDSSPEPSRIAPKSSSSPTLTSPTVQESPFFNYASNLSPIKSAKGAVQYAQRSMDTTLPTPLPVFTSPRMDLQRGNSLLGRDEKFEAGFNVYKQGGMLANVERIPSFEKEIQSGIHSGSVDEYLTEPVGLKDSMISADKEFTATKETITKVVSLDGNTEIQAIMLKDQAAENLSSSSLKLFASAVDWRDNNIKFKKDFPEFMSEKDESDINEDHVSEAVNDEQHATQEASQHRHGIRRHLQFEAAQAYEGTTSYNGNNLCSLTHDNANVRSPASLTNLKSLVSFQYETEASSNQQQVNFFQSVPQQFSSYHSFELLSSTQNCGNPVMSNPMPRGIGLHLNSIGMSDVYASERLNNDHSGSQAMLEASSDTSHFTDHVNPPGHPLQLALIDQHTTPCDGRMYASQDTDKVEELNQQSPKRRRKRSTYMVEGCKRCNCKRSKCLKLYCECFAAGVYCVDSCACENCYNKPEFEDTVLDTRQQIESRNPLAFAPKVVKHAADSPVNVTEEGNWSTPTSARHKRGCNCKKSKCLKKYCECYQAKVGCSDGCRCEGCQNSFGIKAVAETIYKRAEKWDSFTNEKMDALNSGNADQASWEPLVDITNMAPLPNRSSGVWTPSSSNTGDYSKVSGAQLYPGSRFQSSSPSSFQWNCSPDSLIEQLCENKTSHNHSSNNAFYDLIDDDTPQMLKENSTPNRAVKAFSPNQKRDTPPQFGSQGQSSGSPHGLRGGRRFILQSMPSFPPLTPHSKSRDKYNLDWSC